MQDLASLLVWTGLEFIGFIGLVFFWELIGLYSVYFQRSPAGCRCPRKHCGN